MRIFLVGYMGSGKSRFGKKLARKMKLQFYDLDDLIEHKAGRSISDIFRDLGENRFRKIENDCLNKIRQKENIVLATGGGTPCFFNNMQTMNELGLTIYLKMEAGMLANRIDNSKTERPLIKNMKGEALKDFIRKNLKEREQFYLQAKQIVNISSTKIDEIIEIIKS
ncbi:MAG: shikimate kinase [Bacteroidota bacterium]|nr:shikimate kinase [Bacteroidota bacterium]